MPGMVLGKGAKGGVGSTGVLLETSVGVIDGAGVSKMGGAVGVGMTGTAVGVAAGVETAVAVLDSGVEGSSVLVAVDCCWPAWTSLTLWLNKVRIGPPAITTKRVRLIVMRRTVKRIFAPFFRWP